MFLFWNKFLLRYLCERHFFALFMRNSGLFRGPLTEYVFFVSRLSKFAFSSRPFDNSSFAIFCRNLSFLIPFDEIRTFWWNSISSATILTKFASYFRSLFDEIYFFAGFFDKIWVFFRDCLSKFAPFPQFFFHKIRVFLTLWRSSFFIAVFWWNSQFLQSLD